MRVCLCISSSQLPAHLTFQLNVVQRAILRASHEGRFGRIDCQDGSVEALLIDLHDAVSALSPELNSHRFLIGNIYQGQ